MRETEFPQSGPSDNMISGMMIGSCQGAGGLLSRGNEPCRQKTDLLGPAAPPGSQTATSPCSRDKHGDQPQRSSPESRPC